MKLIIGTGARNLLSAARYEIRINNRNNKLLELIRHDWIYIED